MFAAVGLVIAVVERLSFQLHAAGDALEALGMEALVQGLNESFFGFDWKIAPDAHDLKVVSPVLLAVRFVVAAQAEISGCYWLPAKGACEALGVERFLHGSQAFGDDRCTTDGAFFGNELAIVLLTKDLILVVDERLLVKSDVAFTASEMIGTVHAVQGHQVGSADNFFAVEANARFVFLTRAGMTVSEWN